MLKKPHRKATPQGVLQGIAELLDRAGISHRAKHSSEEVNNCFEGKTLEGTHLYRVAKRKNSRAPTPCLRAFRRNRGLLQGRGECREYIHRRYERKGACQRDAGRCV